MISKAVIINGLTINDEVAAKALRYNGWISIDEVDGLDAPEIRNEIQELAFQDGVIMSESYYSERLLTLGCITYGTTRASRNALEYALRTALNPIIPVGQTISVVYREEGEAFDRVIFCRPTDKFKASRKKQEYGKRQLQFSLISEDPRIYKNVLSTRILTLNKNLLLWTEDITNAAWVAYGTPTKVNATDLTLPSANDGYQQTVTTGNHANKTYTFSVELKGVPGETIKIYIRDGGSGTVAGNVVPAVITLTASYVRYSFTGTFTAAQTATTTLAIIRRIDGTTATTLSVRKMQLEEHASADIYRKNDGTYGGTNGTSLPTLIPTLLGSLIGETYTITNSGNYSTIPVIRVYGPLVNAGLINDTTQQYLQFNYNLGSGRYLDIDFRNRRIVLDDGSLIYGSITKGSSFWKLAAGANVIALMAATYTAGYATIDWRDAFI